MASGILKNNKTPAKVQGKAEVKVVKKKPPPVAEFMKKIAA